MRANRFPALLALPVVLALGSCGPQRNQFAPACPVPGLVQSLSEWSRYRGASQDVRDLIIQARIVNVAGKCEPGDNPNTVVATAVVSFEMTRGPAMAGLTDTLPFFVAVTDADAIRDKRLYGLGVEFPRDVNTTAVSSQPIRMELPVTAEKSAAAYGILAGFQLTPEEVAARRRNPR
jgi:hypothetical protein